MHDLLADSLDESVGVQLDKRFFGILMRRVGVERADEFVVDDEAG